MHYPITDDTPFILKIEMGLIPGFSIIHSYGINPNVNTAGVEETVWPKGGIYNFIPTAVPFYLSSSDAGDTTQLFNVRVLDENYVESSMVMQLNGQSPVLVPGGNYIRMNGCANVSPNNNPSIGDVSIGTEAAPVGGVPAASNTIAFIRALAQIDEQSTFTVPAGHTGFIFNFAGSIGKNRDGILHGAFREFGGTFKNTEQLALYQENASVSLPYQKMTEKSDLMIVATTENNNTGMAGSFDIIVVNNAYLD